MDYGYFTHTVEVNGEQQLLTTFPEIHTGLEQPEGE